jgi:hypothetical protein
MLFQLRILTILSMEHGMIRLDDLMSEITTSFADDRSLPVSMVISIFLSRKKGIKTPYLNFRKGHC